MRVAQLVCRVLVFSALGLAVAFPTSATSLLALEGPAPLAAVRNAGLVNPESMSLILLATGLFGVAATLRRLRPS
jgi:hypothetical protein